MKDIVLAVLHNNESKVVIGSECSTPKNVPIQNFEYNFMLTNNFCYFCHLYYLSTSLLPLLPLKRIIKKVKKNEST